MAKTKVDLGPVVGPKGKDAKDFAFDVEDGELFVTYEDPDSAPEFSLSESGHLMKTIDGVTVDLGNVKGPKGDKGDTGPAGNGGSSKAPLIWVQSGQVAGKLNLYNMDLSELAYNASLQGDVEFNIEDIEGCFENDAKNVLITQMIINDSSYKAIPVQTLCKGASKQDNKGYSSVQIYAIPGQDYRSYTSTTYNIQLSVNVITTYYNE